MTMQIAGIVGNERIQGDLRLEQDPVSYVPIAQAPRLQGSFYILEEKTPKGVKLKGLQKMLIIP